MLNLSTQTQLKQERQMIRNKFILNPYKLQEEYDKIINVCSFNDKKMSFDEFKQHYIDKNIDWFN